MFYIINKEHLNEKIKYRLLAKKEELKKFIERSKKENYLIFCEDEPICFKKDIEAEPFCYEYFLGIRSILQDLNCTILETITKIEDGENKDYKIFFKYIKAKIN